MSYIEYHLQEGERVLYVAKKHKVVFCLAAIWCLLTILFRLGGIPMEILWLMRAVAIGTVLYAYFVYARSACVLTNQRLVVNEGFNGRLVLAVPLAAVESISFRQTPLGERFNFGNITINSDEGAGRFGFVASPKTLCEQVSKHLD